MNILKKLGTMLSSPAGKGERTVYLYVQCGRCGEKLRARVDTWNELTPDFKDNSDNPASYFCRKVLIGEKLCYQPVELRLTFNHNRKLIKQEIHGGKYIDRAEFTAGG